MKSLSNHPIVVIFVALFLGLSFQLYASLGEPPYDGLSKEERSLVLSDSNASVVYWALEAERGFQQVPKEYIGMTATQVRTAQKALIIEHQSVKEWKDNPLRFYINQSLKRLPPEEIQKIEDVLMSYVYSDIKNNPVNEALHETKFYDGNLSLIRSYSDYIFSKMEDKYSLSNLSGESLFYVGGTSEMIEVLGKLEDAAVRELNMKIADKLVAKFDGDDANKVREAINKYLDVDETHQPLSVAHNTSNSTDSPEDASQPKVGTEEPAEVVAAKPIEEDAEQSSNWWLWLIGLLVVVGGVLVVRRKN